MPYRVIQWYTGSIAREQIRLVRQHPELELVGAVVHHEDKVGKDTTRVCGSTPRSPVARNTSASASSPLRRT